jgi:hypothetical protein
MNKAKKVHYQYYKGLKTVYYKINMGTYFSAISFVRHEKYHKIKERV